MAVFSSPEEAEKIFASFFEHITLDPRLRPKFVEAATSFRALYTDPECSVSLVTTVDPPRIAHGQAARDEDVEVEMRMSADDGHKFWMGELNIPIALARRKVKVEGPVTKLLKLLPAMQPAFGMYKDFLRDNGYADKLEG